MAESSSNTTTANAPDTTSETDTIVGQSPPDKHTQKQPINHCTYDFYLQLRPIAIHTLLSSFSALSDTQFNPTQTGLMHVSPAGFSITVKPELEQHVFEVLALKAVHMISFQFSNTVTKVVDLQHLYYVTKEAVDNLSTVVVYALSGSNQLSFEFDHGGKPKIVDMVDDSDFEYEFLPQLSYKFKCSMPFSQLKDMIQGITKIEPTVVRPQNVKLRIRTPRWKMATATGYVLEQVGAHLSLQMTWRHWDTLEKAAEVAEDVVVYLAKDMDGEYRVILRLKLKEVGEMFFLQRAFI
ncbi:hypothetical protein vseg_004332 [Gypsophila vaccaria]